MGWVVNAIQNTRTNVRSLFELLIASEQSLILSWIFEALDGKVSQLEHVFIQGSKVRFMVIPDMLKNAPMFKRLEARIKGKGSTLGVRRGRAVAMRARAQAAGRGAPLGRGVVPPIRR
ncbi:small nuclear ribonucleoprotein SmD3b-like [Coffea eugenioides]|uniref:small nuclear ribonucleoprotein SmD3b-like n=1 Tax=Coffea eugenioides TaxID=49369 RepID=UPI000F60E79D|nr:small nuclear ribonucleoprotein SmD3b-like [Coffea eugenioides]